MVFQYYSEFQKSEDFGLFHCIDNFAKKILIGFGHIIVKGKVMAKTL